MANISQGFGKIILNISYIVIKYLAEFYLNIKFYGIINDPLPVLPGNEQDLGHENIVNTYLFNQVCKVHNIVCLGDKPANAKSQDTLASDISS